MKTLASLITAAAAAAALVVAVPLGVTGAAAAPKKYVGSSCGVGAPIPDGEGKWIHLSPITNRKGITCAHAKRVAKDALEAEEGLLCDASTSYRAWKVRHRGGEQAMAARFTRGAVRFDVAEQGGC